MNEQKIETPPFLFKSAFEVHVPISKKMLPAGPRLVRRGSRSRSRSVTPVPERRDVHRPSSSRRALLMRVAAEQPREPELLPSSPRSKPITAYGVERTPRGSVYVSSQVSVMQTPRGSIRRAEPSITHRSIIERGEAMDMSDEEAEELVEAAPWHLQPWTVDLMVEAVDEEVGQGISSPQPTTSGGRHEGPASPVASTSGLSGISCLRPRHGDGSDFDSDFDDEFDVPGVETTVPVTGCRKDIPDDEELEEPIRDIITDIERGMDDEADRLLGVSNSFEWVEGFESFRGVPEVFSGPTPGPLRDYDSAYDTFIDIWDKDIIERIVLETNRYAKQTIDDLKGKGKLKPSSRLHRWTDTNEDEMMGLFGVLMYMAIDSRTSQREYWKSGDLEMPRFRQLISYNRYVLLMKFLHFVDNSELPQNAGTPSVPRTMSRKLFKLSPIIDHLGIKFNTLYNMERNIAIDESLTLFKGRLSWVQSIRTKAARFGIKSYELCESRTGYMAKFQIYTGKSDVSSNPALSVELGGKTTKVVLELLDGLAQRGHCVTMDNFYNCPALARYLKSLHFDCLGTLRKNRRNVPSDISKVPKNVPKGTIISRQCGDVSLVTWKDSKLVNIISTYHNDDTYLGSKAGKPLRKPVCVRDYNSTMGGVDLKDQKLSMYLLERKRGLKWYVKMFKRLLNVSIHNAFIMYVSSLQRRGKPTVTHREFRYELAKSLVERLRPRRQEIPEVVGELMRLRRDIMHEPKCLTGKKHERKRCVMCSRLNKTKWVFSQCTTCDVFVCFGDCWKNWHSSRVLEGREVRGRKRRRDE